MSKIAESSTQRTTSRSAPFRNIPVDILSHIFFWARHKQAAQSGGNSRFYFLPPTRALMVVCRDWYAVLERHCRLYTTLVVQVEYMVGGRVMNAEAMQTVLARSGQCLLDVIVVPPYELIHGPHASTTPFDSIPWLMSNGLPARCKTLAFAMPEYPGENFFSLPSTIALPRLEEISISNFNDHHVSMEAFLGAPTLKRLSISYATEFFKAGRPVVQNIPWTNLQVIHFIESPCSPSDLYTLIQLSTSLTELKILCRDDGTYRPMPVVNTTLHTFHVKYKWEGPIDDRLFGIFELYTLSSLSSLGIYTKQVWWGSSRHRLNYMPSIVQNHPWVESFAIGGLDIEAAVLADSLARIPRLKTLSLGRFEQKGHMIATWYPSAFLTALVSAICPCLEKLVLIGARGTMSSLRTFARNRVRLRMIELQEWQYREAKYELRWLQEGGRVRVLATKAAFHELEGGGWLGNCM
ncbi:hypothetical protein DFP72DRAFT_845014 [Ephemerocybe angulata]|uniref:F-box domain-containing protein n=1 Tax=Ephemerocybe angulata TaxID=980116 RepID=A0A8H6M7F9_9AGAR|nr:hypothetical protein DFP72DRAFT_845014 [Tulosesus angulatus]